jgi:hypothetical protein
LERPLDLPPNLNAWTAMHPISIDRNNATQHGSIIDAWHTMALWGLIKLYVSPNPQAIAEQALI